MKALFFKSKQRRTTWSTDAQGQRLVNLPARHIENVSITLAQHEETALKKAQTDEAQTDDRNSGQEVCLLFVPVASTCQSL